MAFFDFHHHKKNHTKGIYNLEIFEKIPDSIPFSAGIHPVQTAVNIDEYMEWFTKTAKHQNCIAIGECGLDARSELSDSEQRQLFTNQILLANDLRKPIIVHCVRKWQELLKFIEISEVAMIVHGFNKNVDLAKQLLSKGFYLSFGNALLHNVSLQQVLNETDPEKYFLETDAADINIEDLYQTSAKVTNKTTLQIQKQILENLGNIIFKENE